MKYIALLWVFLSFSVIGRADLISASEVARFRAEAESFYVGRFVDCSQVVKANNEQLALLEDSNHPIALPDQVSVFYAGSESTSSFQEKPLNHNFIFIDPETIEIIEVRSLKGQLEARHVGTIHQSKIWPPHLPLINLRAAILKGKPKLITTPSNNPRVLAQINAVAEMNRLLAEELELFTGYLPTQRKYTLSSHLPVARVISRQKNGNREIYQLLVAKDFYFGPSGNGHMSQVYVVVAVHMERQQGRFIPHAVVATHFASSRSLIRQLRESVDR
ncbi:MAG: hypothetical protein H6626_05610 [Pseudobdellovibrionaceae bacterium]|nr:hypothetical protein [Bdellovibrionales bacterium]USN48570.1 MAG: hypothetical protein H6626_05610 [Pseudobdellovibrionaceae bacterium]